MIVETTPRHSQSNISKDWQAYAVAEARDNPFSPPNNRTRAQGRRERLEDEGTWEETSFIDQAHRTVIQSEIGRESKHIIQPG